MKINEILQKSIKEGKRHNSVNIPLPPISNFYQMNSVDNDNNSQQSNSTTVDPPGFHIKSHSLFAYQEIDHFSSFCDGEERNNNNKIIQDEYFSKDSLTDSKKDISLDDIIKNDKNNKKRRSTFNILPPQLVNDLGFNQVNNNSEINNINKNDIINTNIRNNN